MNYLGQIHSKYKITVPWRILNPTDEIPLPKIPQVLFTFLFLNKQSLLLVKIQNFVGPLLKVFLLRILSIFVRFVFIFANLKIVFWLTPSIMNQFSREFLLDLYSIGKHKYSFLWLTSLWIHLSKRNSLENYCEYKAFRFNPKRPPVRRLVVEERVREKSLEYYYFGLCGSFLKAKRVIYYCDDTVASRAFSRL